MPIGALRAIKLPEPAVVGRYCDIARQHNFDADRKDNSLNGGHNRLATAILKAEDINRCRQRMGRLGSLKLSCGGHASSFLCLVTATTPTGVARRNVLFKPRCHFLHRISRWPE
jgi:hypothetical protein